MQTADEYPRSRRPHRPVRQHGFCDSAITAAQSAPQCTEVHAGPPHRNSASRHDNGASELMSSREFPPAIRAVRALPTHAFLRREVADALGVSAATLRRLAASSPDLSASAVLHFGAVTVPVYDISVVELLHAYLT